MNLLHTSVAVTLTTSVLLLLFRITEHSPPSASTVHIEQIMDVADQYYDDAKRVASDDIERLRLKAMALALLRYANASLRIDVLENVSGYSVGRRIKHLEQDLARLRQNIARGAVSTD
jgi:hypothetical protein